MTKTSDEQKEIQETKSMDKTVLVQATNGPTLSRSVTSTPSPRIQTFSMYMHFIEAEIFTIRLGNHTVCYVVVNLSIHYFALLVISSAF